MDKFVKKAFEDARDAVTHKEAHAFDERIVKNIETISVACGVAVGLKNMDALSGVILRAGLQETFSEWTKMVMTIAFSEGYEAAVEEVGK